MITVIQDTKSGERGWWIIDAPAVKECYGYQFLTKRAAVAVAHHIVKHPEVMADLLLYKLEMIPHHLVKVLNR
jgi:hypothetical protein